jgi:hypothetical protein
MIHVLGDEDVQVWVPADARVHAFHRTANAAWVVGDHGFVLAYDRANYWHFLRGDPDVNGRAGAAYGLRDIASAALPDGSVGLWAVGEPDTIIHSTESQVLAVPPITPAPTREPWPTTFWPLYDVYLPRVDRQPPGRSAPCGRAPSAPVADIERAALETGRYYAEGGPAPEPALRDLEMLTVGSLAQRHGVDLVGAEVAGRVLTADMCVWWARLDGWFDCRCGGTATAEPDHTWRRLSLALLPEDGTVLYEDFSDKASESPPTATATPPVATPLPSATLPFAGRGRERGRDPISTRTRDVGSPGR